MLKDFLFLANRNGTFYYHFQGEHYDSIVSDDVTVKIGGVLCFDTDLDKVSYTVMS